MNKKETIDIIKSINDIQTTIGRLESIGLRVEGDTSPGNIGNYLYRSTSRLQSLIADKYNADLEEVDNIISLNSHDPVKCERMIKEKGWEKMIMSKREVAP